MRCGSKVTLIGLMEDVIYLNRVQNTTFIDGRISCHTTALRNGRCIAKRKLDSLFSFLFLPLFLYKYAYVCANACVAMYVCVGKPMYKSACVTVCVY